MAVDKCLILSSVDISTFRNNCPSGGVLIDPHFVNLGRRVAVAGKFAWSPEIANCLDLKDGLEYFSLVLQEEAFPLPGLIELCQEKVSM